MPNYGNQKYWDKRYANKPGETFDWLEDYNSLKSLLYDNIDNIRKRHGDPAYNPLILNLGCGNSTICENMYDDGFTNIVNIDISTVCIAQMAARNQHSRPFMKFQVMDALDMQFQDDTFDLVIDKSTLDAILCGKQSFLNASKMIFQSIPIKI